MPLFDSYIFIDWSAKNEKHRVKPTVDAPWVGEFTPQDHFQNETYRRTRQSAVDYVLRRLLDHIKGGRRVLIGFDFPYGYPRNFAQALRLQNGQDAWKNVWAELSSRLSDTDTNVNNRFSVASELNCIISDEGQGPLWGCPSNQATQHLETTGPGFPYGAANGLRLERLRICESRLSGVLEVWGLYGAGRVGSQVLTGIPRVNSLRHHNELKNISKVWPFETGFSPTPSPESGPFILHAEIWPGVVEHDVRKMTTENTDLIRDQAQVRAMCKWAAELDQNGTLGTYFDVPASLDSTTIEQCIQEEGWILGAP